MIPKQFTQRVIALYDLLMKSDRSLAKDFGSKNYRSSIYIEPNEMYATNGAWLIKHGIPFWRAPESFTIPCWAVRKIKSAKAYIKYIEVTPDTNLEHRRFTLSNGDILEFSLYKGKYKPNFTQFITEMRETGIKSRAMDDWHKILSAAVDIAILNYKNADVDFKTIRFIKSGLALPNLDATPSTSWVIDCLIPECLYEISYGFDAPFLNDFLKKFKPPTKTETCHFYAKDTCFMLDMGSIIYAQGGTRI